jgi:hypothetical protein
MAKSLSAEKREQIESYIRTLYAEIRRCEGLLGDGYVIGPWLLEMIRKTSDPPLWARILWLHGNFTPIRREHVEIGLRKGELRPLDWMDNLYEVVVDSSAFTREIAEAVAQSVISHFIQQEAARPRRRTGPGRYHDFYWCGKKILIRGNEFGVVRYVWRRLGRVAKVADIYRKVWDRHDEVGKKELDCVEATVKRIRKKLADTPVDISFSRRDETVSIEIHWPTTVE